MAITHVGTGAAVFGANDFTPAIPGGAAGGDMMLLLVGGKPFNATFGGAMAPGWTQLSTFTDGSVAAGTDAGSMQVTAWWKEHDGSEVDPLVDEGGTAFNVFGGLVMAWSKGAGEVWETPVMVGGGDSSAGTGFDVTCNADPGGIVGDHIVWWAAYRSDAATPMSTANFLSWTGATVAGSTTDPATDPETTTGGDMGMHIRRASISAGTSSLAPVIAGTLAAAHTGSAALIRLRATTPPAILPPPLRRRNRRYQSQSVRRASSW